MKVNVMCVLDHDDCAGLPYGVICECRYGARWNTGRRKRMWMAEFSESDRQKATKIFRQSYSMMLGKGIPDRMEMSPSTLTLWKRLGDFCASL